MLITSILNPPLPPTKFAVYPKLMSSNHQQFIVLFTESGYGMVVQSSEPSSYPVGKYSRTWSVDEFHDYSNPITLINEVT